MKITKNIRSHIGQTLAIRWGTSRGRYTYGYTTCSLRNHHGKRVAACNGGGYDMRGTVVGDWIARTFPNELRALRLEKMPEHSHWEPAQNRKHANDGKRINDGRYFYGLSFHDPNYDPGKAVIGADCVDRTLTKGDTGSAGKTVADAEAAGNSFELERLNAIYSASSKHATKRHTIPSIDGACGFSSVMEIARALGFDLRCIVNTSKLDVYEIVKAAPRA